MIEYSLLQCFENSWYSRNKKIVNLIFHFEHDWTFFILGANLDRKIGKYLIKSYLLHLNRDRLTWNIKCAKFQLILGTFNFGTNLGLKGRKCLIKIVFDIKVEIGILEISNVSNFSKFWALLILGPTWAKQVVSI